MCVQVINEGTSTSGGAAFGSGVCIGPSGSYFLTEPHHVTSAVLQSYCDVVLSMLLSSYNHSNPFMHSKRAQSVARFGPGASGSNMTVDMLESMLDSPMVQQMVYP